MFVMGKLKWSFSVAISVIITSTVADFLLNRSDVTRRTSPKVPVIHVIPRKLNGWHFHRLFMRRTKGGSRRILLPLAQHRTKISQNPRFPHSNLIFLMNFLEASARSELNDGPPAQFPRWRVFSQLSVHIFGFVKARASPKYTA